MPRETALQNELDARSTDYLCDQCGQGIPFTTVEKRKSRNELDWGLCSDCTRKPVRQIIYNHPVLGSIACFPHLGDVDELWRPLDDSGQLFRPGERLCGHQDCINSSHILGTSKQRHFFPQFELERTK